MCVCVPQLKLTLPAVCHGMWVSLMPCQEHAALAKGNSAGWLGTTPASSTQRTRQCGCSGPPWTCLVSVGCDSCNSCLVAKWCWRFPCMCHTQVAGCWQREEEGESCTHTTALATANVLHHNHTHTQIVRPKIEAVHACTHCTRRLLFTPSACWIELGQKRCRPVGWYTTKC